jgi:antitoxin component YwqK of YwqJK toxin-antitoxin module
MWRLAPLLLVLTISCTSSEYRPVRSVNVVKQLQIDAFSDSLYSLTQLDLRAALTAIEGLSDTIYLRSYKEPNPEIPTYANTAAHTYFEVLLNDQDLPRAITYYRNGQEINGAEYYPNGQVICQHPSAVDGKRNGRYTCFHESGEVNKIGFYRNNVDVRDSVRVVEAELR